jgi:outer membrane protein TolC
MEKRKYFIIMFLIVNCQLSIVNCFAQLSIEECYAKAQANYPLIKQYGLIEKSRDYNLSNAGKGYLPQITFSAKASYQSEVTEIPAFISLPPGVKGMSKDQYGAALDINQVVWDGGTVKSRMETVRTSSEMETKSLEVDIYAINDRVNQLFFGILLFDAQLEQNRLFSEELGRNYDKVLSCVQNGIANQADVDAVKVEQLKAIQAKSQLTYQKSAYLDMLSALTGETITALVKPDELSFADVSIQRPELQFFNAKINHLEAQNSELNASLKPKLGVFLTGGYGNPGLNMLKSGFSAYYIVGARLAWNFGNFYSNQNNKQLIQNNINTVLTQQETFLFNVNLDISKRQRELEKYRDQMKYDDEIIALRTSVKQASEAKMANGTLSGNDLMRDVHAEELAKQDKILHETELLLAMYSLKWTIDKE